MMKKRNVKKSTRKSEIEIKLIAFLMRCPYRHIRFFLALDVNAAKQTRSHFVFKRRQWLTILKIGSAQKKNDERKMRMCSLKMCRMCVNDFHSVRPFAYNDRDRDRDRPAKRISFSNGSTHATHRRSERNLCIFIALDTRMAFDRKTNCETVFDVNICKVFVVRGLLGMGFRCHPALFQQAIVCHWKRIHATARAPPNTKYITSPIFVRWTIDWHFRFLSRLRA